MRRKAAALAALLAFFGGVAPRGGAESVLQRITREIPASPEAEEAPVLRMRPLEETPAADSGEAEETAPVLRMRPLSEETPAADSGEAEETAPVLSMVSPETPAPEITEAPDSRGIWIRGPGRMKAGTKKYFKVVYEEEKPRKAKVTWSLDCDAKTAQVFRNGQVWIRPKTASGTVLTLSCHVEGRDAQGQPWTAEARMEITVP